MIIYFSFIDDYEDKKLFEKLFYTYRKQMLCLASSYVHNQADAEDIVHDVFLNVAQRQMSVIKHIEKYEDKRNYLLKATKNTALNKIRNNKKNSVFIDNAITEKIDDNDFIDRICQAADYSQVIGAIGEMDELYRNSLYYHFVLELPISDVARLLNQSTSATKKQLVRGKKILLSLLKEKGM